MKISITGKCIILYNNVFTLDKKTSISNWNKALSFTFQGIEAITQALLNN